MTVFALVAGCGPAAPWTARPITGASFTIQPPMSDHLREIDSRERHEQIRDWAVIGTVAQLGATPAQAAATTYQLPPERLAYLDELYSFEYGRGRRAYLDGRVLLFRDGDDPDPQATLGRLADRVRMENGALPSTVEVYLIQDLQDQGLIRIDRARDVPSQELFSSVYGYVEGDVHDASSLASWLARVDDLTYAKLGKDGHLLLGGRRLGHTRTANLTAEDVAALYQAHEELEKPRRQAREQLARLSPEAKAAADRAIETFHRDDGDHLEQSLALYEALSLVPPDQRTPAKEAMFELGGSPRSPGFSLDPEWLPDPTDPRHPLLLARLRAFAADPCRELQALVVTADALEAEESDPTRRTSRATRAIRLRDVVKRASDLPTACAQIRRLFSPRIQDVVASAATAPRNQWDSKLLTLYQFRKEVGSALPAEQRTAGNLVRGALRFYESDTKVQCGQYFGVGGTRVGMTLYYTDLLAKLWQSTDYARSAPIFDIPGFLAIPRIPLPAVFLDELYDKSDIRLWFGPRANGVSRTQANNDSIVIFDHRFTRVYAAGSDPATPGVESSPAENARRALTWWDNHYDDVADYEQEYHRLNQITKWALITATILETTPADYLRTMHVQRGLEFRPWYAANRRSVLRFSEDLPPPAAGISCTECLPLLASYEYVTAGEDWTIHGGVSTVARDAPKKVPVLDTTEPLGERRPHIDDLGAGKAGTATHSIPVRTGTEVVFEHGEKVVTRSRAGNVKLGAPVVQYEPGSGKGGITVRAGSDAGDIGVLDISLRTHQVDLEWRPGDIERARFGALIDATNLEQADRLASRGQAIAATRGYDRLAATTPTSAADLARAAIANAAHLRPEPVLRRLVQLKGQGAQLSPELRRAMLNAVGDVATPAAKQLAENMLEAGKPSAMTEGTGLTVERGHIIATRDVDHLVAKATPSKAPTDLDNAEVYVADDVRISREGATVDLGGDVSRLLGRPGVTMEELDRSTIGELSPDRVVDKSTKTTLRHVGHEAWARSSLRSRPPMRVFAIRYNPPTQSPGPGTGGSAPNGQGGSSTHLPVIKPAKPADTGHRQIQTSGSNTPQGERTTARCAQ